MQRTNDTMFYDSENHIPESRTSPNNNNNNTNSSNTSTYSNTAGLENQEDTVEGVPWINPNSPLPSGNFVDTFLLSIRYSDMSGRAKMLVRERFIDLYQKYKGKTRMSGYYTRFTSIFVTIGTLLIPATLAVGDNITDTYLSCADAYKVIYVGIVVLSFMVSVVNALAELFQIRKRYYMDVGSLQMIEFEGWCFILLRGPYSIYKTHRHCWEDFLFRTERIHHDAANMNVLLYKGSEYETTRGRFSATGNGEGKQGEDGDIYGDYIMNELKDIINNPSATVTVQH